MDEKSKKSMQASINEGVLNSAATSITSTYAIPLALALGANGSQIGLMNFAQNAASTAGNVPGAYITRLMSRKNIWLMCQVAAKVLVWLPILFIPIASSSTFVYMLMVLVALSAFFASLRGSAWTSLMGDIVPPGIRGRYFARRNAVAGISGLVAVVASGAILATIGFGILFLASIVLSVICIFLFWQMHEPPTKTVYHYKPYFGLPKDIRKQITINKGFVIFTVYLALMYAATEVAAPFYAVYMLTDLDFSYASFAIVTAFGALIRIVSMRYWGRFIDRFGSRKILVITGVFGCLTPLLWIFVQNVEGALIVKVFDGLIWGGFDLVVFNYLLDITPADKRPFYIANHSLFVGIGVMAGALAGSVLAGYVALNPTPMFAGIHFIFIISFVSRLVVTPLLFRVREAEVSQRSLLPVRYVFWRIAAVEPTTGIRNMLHYTFRYPYDRQSYFKQKKEKSDKWDT